MSVSKTLTVGPKRRATFAVSSVHPLQTTTTQISSEAGLPTHWLNVRAMTELSLWAGTTIEIMVGPVRMDEIFVPRGCHRFGQHHSGALASHDDDLSLTR